MRHQLEAMKKILTAFFSIILLATFAQAQTAEVKISLNEQFFDALLDSMFKNAAAPEFPLSENNPKTENTNQTAKVLTSNYLTVSAAKNVVCPETIRLQRQIDGVNTAVRFRQGKIYVPLAFTGNYNPPLIGCVGFSGWAETNIVLSFDRQRQALIGTARVLNVNLSGTGGLGSSLLTRLVQSSIDQKINPIEIIRMDKISFNVPVQNAGNINMKAIGMRHQVGDGVLDIYVSYQFSK